MTIILDGKALNEKIAQKLKAEISRLETLRARGPLGRRPKLVIIQVGDLAQSNAYIGRKVKFGEKIGAVVEHKRFDEKITQKDLITRLLTLDSDKSVHGIIVQMPLPKHIDKDEIIDSIDPAKDVDGLTSRNLKLLWENKTTDYSSSEQRGPRSLSTLSSRPKGSRQARTINAGFIPATTKGIISLLDEYKIPIEGKHVVVVGRSFLVGKPTSLAFLNRDATVTICHRHTKNLAQITKSADILVVAAGKPNLIGKEHVSKNQVVIDVGINAIEQLKQGLSLKTGALLQGQSLFRSLKLVGDVNFRESACRLHPPDFIIRFTIYHLKSTI